eukprot:7434947-Lingulodinium_polyedra.AAC.1
MLRIGKPGIPGSSGLSAPILPAGASLVNALRGLATTSRASRKRGSRTGRSRLPPGWPESGGTISTL